MVIAKTGAKSAEVAVAPAVGVTIHNISARATIGTGATIPLTGAIDALAEMTASATTTAQGDTEADDAAVGIAIALTFADHRVESGTNRNLTAGGAVGFAALGSSVASAVAKASAAGAPGREDDPDGRPVTSTSRCRTSVPPPTATPRTPVQADSGNTAAPSAEDSSGDGVSVAASVALTLATSVSRSYVADGRTIGAGGALSVRSSANSDAKATADGTAKNSGEDSRQLSAWASRSTWPTSPNRATIGYGASTTSNGVVVEALMTDAAARPRAYLRGSGISGGSGGDIGVAGSFALNIAVVNTTAAILSDPTGGTPGHAATTVNAGTGDVTINATSAAKSTASAIPAEDGTATGSNVGVGASIALNLVTDTTIATIENTAILTGGDDLTLHAAGAHAMTTLAETGAESERSPSLRVSRSRFPT